MAESQILIENRRGLEKLLALSEATGEALLSALREAPPTMTTFELSLILAGKASTVSREDLEDIANALVSLYLTHHHYPDLEEELVEHICRAMDASQTPALTITNDKRDHFKRLLTALLQTEALVYSSKAIGVLRNNERMFSSARVITVIRPVFGSSVNAPPKAAVIVHMLNITYHQGNEVKEFFVGMSTEDIETFMVILGRANLKANSLEPIFDAAQLKNLNPE
jgi:hypothetical protein